MLFALNYKIAIFIFVLQEVHPADQTTEGSGNEIGFVRFRSGMNFDLRLHESEVRSRSGIKLSIRNKNPV